MAEQIRILLVDDHALLREALRDALITDPGLSVVAEANSGESAVRLAMAHRPEVVLLDVEMPGHHAPTTVGQLLESCPGIHVIIVSMSDDPEMIQQLLSAGVSGYLHKSVSLPTLISAIRTVVQQETQGQSVLLSVPRGGLAARETAKAPDAGLLSARELEVLTHVANALSNRQIASRLGITEGTAKRHLRNIFSKLDAVSRIDAVNKATAAELLG
ncbi:response regulator [Streptomyces sp. NBC_00454]|uniref:response regulator n=1 Tax=Streptomyces sp. NBC_00454 TaxID=2975747 RepID=UPI00324C548B